MGDLHPNLSLFADLDGLGQRFEQPVGLAADVGSIDAATARCHPRQADHLFGAGVKARRVEQPGREATRSLFHGLRHQPLHLGLLLWCRLDVVETQYRTPHRVVTDQGHHVHGGPWVAQTFQILGHTRPRDVQANALGLSPRLLHSRAQQRGRRAAAVADDLRGHSLADFALGPGVNQQGKI